VFSHPELIASRLLFVGLVIEAIELWMLRPAFDEGGPLSRGIASVLSAGAPWQTRIGATFGDGQAIGLVALGQGLAAAAVIVNGTGAGVGIAAAVVCLCTNAYLHARRQIGSSGAEQLTLIVLVTFALVLVAGGGEQARRIGDWFIGTQVILAYFASGVSKLLSPTWRRGEAMRGILSTEGYGVPALSRVLTARPRADVFLCWSVIVWETLFPLVLVGPRSMLIGMLALGVLFHASCALLMGLNRFPWAFCGCYTAVWVTAASVQSR
jgi:hypothetical protein